MEVIPLPTNGGDTTSTSKGEKKKRKALASKVPTIASLAPKRSRRGVLHRGTAKDKPSGSQAVPLPPIAIPPSPVANVATLIKDYASGDEGRTTMEVSPACRRQIKFIEEIGVLEASQPSTDAQEELQP